jgi:Pseudomonas avirulence D protein (AvrD)
VADCVIGKLALHCALRHEAAPEHAPYGAVRDAGQTPNDGPLLLAAGYTRRRQHTRDVCAVPYRMQADATVHIDTPRTPLRASDLVVDTFVVGLQLGQLLLYELDSVTRAESNTLWMRRTLLEVGDQGRPRVASAPVSVRLEKSRLMENTRRQIWRAADIVCEFQDISMRCSVAHQVH